MQTRDILAGLSIAGMVVGAVVTVAAITIGIKAKKDEEKEVKQTFPRSLDPDDAPHTERAKREYELSQQLKETTPRP